MPITTMKPASAIQAAIPNVSPMENVLVTVALYAEVADGLALCTTSPHPPQRPLIAIRSRRTLIVRGNQPTAITAAGNRIATRQPPSTPPLGTDEPPCRPDPFSMDWLPFTVVASFICGAFTQ